MGVGWFWAGTDHDESDGTSGRGGGDVNEKYPLNLFIVYLGIKSNDSYPSPIEPCPLLG
jgi:hypothetical protein